MIRSIKIAIFCLVLISTHYTVAQTAHFPIVKGFGGIFEVPNASESPDPSLDYQIIVDMSTAAADNAEISKWVDNVARLVNLHGLAGVPKDKMHVIVVVHGGAIFTVMNNKQYRDKFKVDNPNIPVYKALQDAGVKVYVCGQSMHARNLKMEDLYDGADIALSALTTITTYVPKGYTMLKF